MLVLIPDRRRALTQAGAHHESALTPEGSRGQQDIPKISPMVLYRKS